MTTDTDRETSKPLNTPFMGLAPFLRMSISGVDMAPMAQEMLAQADTASHGERREGE